MLVIGCRNLIERYADVEVVRGLDLHRSSYRFGATADQRLPDRGATVEHGKSIEVGAPRDLTRSLGGEEIIDFAVNGALVLGEVAQLPSVAPLRGEADGFVLATQQLHDATATAHAALATESGDASRDAGGCLCLFDGQAIT